MSDTPAIERTVHHGATMKTLANCTTKEFLRQANQIRKKAAEYYARCNFKALLAENPDFPAEADEAERMEITKALQRKKIDRVLDICMDENVDGTIEIIGLMCFKTSAEAEAMEANVLLGLALDLISSERVLDFLSKMARSGLLFTEN